MNQRRESYSVGQSGFEGRILREAGRRTIIYGKTDLSLVVVVVVSLFTTPSLSEIYWTHQTTRITFITKAQNLSVAFFRALFAGVIVNAPKTEPILSGILGPAALHCRGRGCIADYGGLCLQQESRLVKLNCEQRGPKQKAKVEGGENAMPSEYSFVVVVVGGRVPARFLIQRRLWCQKAFMRHALIS